MTDKINSNPVESKTNLFEALSKAQGAFPVVKKNASTGGNGKFGYSYVTLDAIIEAIRKPLADNGLGFYQEIKQEPAQGVLTTVFHKSGEKLAIFCPFIGNYSTMQQLGSCITYARRYGLQTAVGVFAEEDDDGAKATEANKNTGHHGQNNRPQSYSNQKQAQAPMQLSEGQIKRFWALAKEANVSKDNVDAMLKNWKLDSIKNMSRAQYDTACNHCESIIARLKNEKQKEESEKKRNHKGASDVTFTIEKEEAPKEQPPQQSESNSDGTITVDDVPFN